MIRNGFKTRCKEARDLRPLPRNGRCPPLRCGPGFRASAPLPSAAWSFCSVCLWVRFSIASLLGERWDDEVVTAPIFVPPRRMMWRRADGLSTGSANPTCWTSDVERLKRSGGSSISSGVIGLCGYFGWRIVERKTALSGAQAIPYRPGGHFE